MRELFSKELLADIHIRLDREGLQGLSEKEISVLLSETITDSATFIVNQITGHAEAQTDRLIQHIDAQTELLIQHIDAQTERLMKHSEIQTDRIIRELGNKIDEAIQPIHAELAYFRFWVKILVGGVWAVAASIIASILFQLLTK
jgi:hypothetical protein